MSGFDLNRFVSLPAILAKHLKCSICHGLLNEAVTNDCGHTYCRHCINNLIVVGYGWLCPECRHPLATHWDSDNKDDRSAFMSHGYCLVNNLRINSLIGELKIRCRYQPDGCPQVLQLDLMAAHEDRCGYRKCTTCGLIVGGYTIRHSCVSALLADRDICRKQMDTLKAENVELKKQVASMTFKW